jgi:hypothetical protein
MITILQFSGLSDGLQEVSYSYRLGGKEYRETRTFLSEASALAYLQKTKATLCLYALETYYQTCSRHSSGTVFDSAYRQISQLVTGFHNNSISYPSLIEETYSMLDLMAGLIGRKSSQKDYCLAMLEKIKKFLLHEKHILKSDTKQTADGETEESTRPTGAGWTEYGCRSGKTDLF